MDNKIYSHNEMRKDIYDDDYWFFESGKIIYHHDKHETDAGREDVVTADKIPEARKKRILNDCPEELKEKIKVILYPNE